MRDLRSKIAWFREIEADLWAEFEPRLKALRVRKGQLVVGHRSRNSEVYIVLDGEFEVLIHSVTGKQVLLRTIEAGEMFGELAALDGGPRTASVSALTGGTLISIAQSDFRWILARSPSAGLWIARHLGRQLRAMTERCFELSALNVKSRVHCELMRMAIDFGVANNAACILPAPTHESIAQRIGTHREAVTRELRELAAMNIIRQDRRRLQILDFAKLTELVGQSAEPVIWKGGEEKS